MKRVVHFEINADDPERAANFYEKVFNWKISKWDGPMDYWLITTGGKNEPGIDGAITKRENPGATVQNTIDVPSVDEYIKKIEENGGTIVSPKVDIPGVGFVAYFKDTAGNLFGIIEGNMS